MHFFVSRSWLLIVTFIFIFWIINNVTAEENDIINNVIKIKTYEQRLDGSFVFKSFGSAIAIDSSHILTNAHVILGSDEVPTGFYEVCFSVNFETVPVCREVARLIGYDIVADLALLELSHTNSLKPFRFASSKIALGSYVSMYGYPAIGWETITRTDWKIAGYEQMMYKIDGSIDHGNSWGGAFNNSGELVGLPTAVAADNASIWYMIPIQRIKSFLLKDTDNYETYTYSTVMNRVFTKFIRRNQSYIANKPLLKWNALTIKNPHLYWFSLKSNVISNDNKIINLAFSDSYDRVKIIFSCTDDAGGLLGWQVRKDGFTREELSYPTWNMKMEDEEDYFTVYSSSKGYDPNIVMYYKWYDSCFAEINYFDKKMDGKSLKKAINFLKNWISFNKEYIIQDTHSNFYFQTPHLENDTRIIRSIDQFGFESVLIGVEIEKGNWMNAVLETKQFETLQELWAAFEIDFEVSKTWSDYIDLGVKSWLEQSNIHLLSLSSWQNGILYTRYDPDKKLTTIVFEYIYVMDNWHYAYWSWKSTTPGESLKEIARIKDIFEGFVYPGRSFLKN